MWIFLLLLLIIPIIFYIYRNHLKIFGYLSYLFHIYAHDYIQKHRPKRIILLRHGETSANLDPKIYSSTPDNKIELTPNGNVQARDLGKTLKSLIKDQSILFYISTFTRCSQTYENIYRYFRYNKKKSIYDPRIREQEWGNYQHFSKNPEDLQNVMKEREIVGKMYYRFDHGESGCDVYVRVSSFMDSMFRYIDHFDKEKYENIIIVTHGLTMRYFITRFLKLSIEEFESMKNPKNCEFWILENDGNGRYKLVSEIKGLIMGVDAKNEPMSAFV